MDMKVKYALRRLGTNIRDQVARADPSGNECSNAERLGSDSGVLCGIADMCLRHDEPVSRNHWPQRREVNDVSPVRE